MQRKFSAIIPTLFKSPILLNNLLRILNQSESVTEIILINNTTQDLKLENVSLKLNIQTPPENLYVNPSWNYGFKLAQEEYLLILNDDIIISENFIENLSHMSIEDYGLIGVEEQSIQQTLDKTPYQTQEDIIHEATARTWGYGIILVLKKDHFLEIPEEMKIWYGDDYIFNYWKKQGKKNGALKTIVKTQMSITSNLPQFNAIKRRDGSLYKLFCE